MYQTFFSLQKSPFSIAPDPDFLFPSHCHQEAIAHLTYGIQGNGGFVVLIGESGTGKTLICQTLLKSIPDDTDVAFITSPKQSAFGVLAKICEAFNLNFSKENESVHYLFHVISSWMLSNHSQGRKAIILIDDAHQLSFDILEQLRLLTNIESNCQKPLQIILIGQLKLEEALQTKALRQLSQRITARYQLAALNEKEVLFYIKHRLSIAGANSDIFEKKALHKIAKISRGIPSVINLICDKSLLFSFTQERRKVSLQLINRINTEMEASHQVKAAPSYIFPILLFSSVLIAIFLIFSDQV